MENKSLFTPKEGAYSKQETPRNIGNKKLEMIVIAHYVLGVIGVIVSCFALSKSGLGMSLIDQAESYTELEKLMHEVFGWIYIVSGVALFIFGEVLSVCLIVSANFMKRHTAHTFSIFVAAITCTIIPIGTVLGIFTIITLSDKSTKELYKKHKTVRQPQ